MLKGINKAFCAVAICGALFGLSGCGKSDKDLATELYNQAESQINQRHFSEALILLDTLDSRYHDQVEVRRMGLVVRAKAMQGLAMDSIQPASEALAQATIRVEELRDKFYHVDSNVGLDGYFLPKGVDAKMMTATGIQARVSDKGLLYYVVNVQGRTLGLNSFAFVSGADQITSSEISPARIISVEGCESASFNPEDTEGMAQWLLNHDRNVKIVFIGSKGKTEVKMTDKLRQEILECYEYSSALQAQRKASIQREKLERSLQLFRDGEANFYTEPEHR